MRHVWFDTGDGSYIAVMAPTPESGAPERWAGDLNSALWLDSIEELEAMAGRLQEHGVKAVPIWAQSQVFQNDRVRIRSGRPLLSSGADTRRKADRCRSAMSCG